MEWSTIQLNMANVHFWLHARWVVDVTMLTVAALGIQYFRNRKYIQFAQPVPIVREYRLVVLVRLQHATFLGRRQDDEDEDFISIKYVSTCAFGVFLV